MKLYRQQVEEAIAFLQEKISRPSHLGVILGSGMSGILPNMQVDLTVSYADIPHFPHASVTGHSGNLVFGTLDSMDIVLLQGRAHYYEGYSTRELTLPIRVLSGLGTKKLIITNTAGGLNTSFAPGTIMVISDHLNFIGDNPLRGPNVDAWGPRFPDFSKTYDRELTELAISCSKELGIEGITTGVYIAIPGPSLETPAETRFFRSCGGDAIGMSTVPEVIVARHAGMKILGLSLIANVNDPENFQPILQDDVLAKARETGPRLMELITRILLKINTQNSAEESRMRPILPQIQSN